MKSEKTIKKRGGLMMLPDLEFLRWRRKDEDAEDNQLFFRTSNEIKRVVSQGVTASVQLKLPGFFTRVLVCFPVPSLVRVYLDVVRTSARSEVYFIGQWGTGSRFYRLPKKIKYRYGTSLAPWMYQGYLSDEERKKESDTRIVNYFIENCSCGLDGVLLKFRDEKTPQTRQDEWLKLFWLEMGNEFHFFKASEKATAILELFPRRNSRGYLAWEPKGGYGQFKKIRAIPAKTD